MKQVVDLVDIQLNNLINGIGINSKCHTSSDTVVWRGGRTVSLKEVGPEKSWKLMQHYMVQGPGKLLPSRAASHCPQTWGPLTMHGLISPSLVGYLSNKLPYHQGQCFCTRLIVLVALLPPRVESMLSYVISLFSSIITKNLITRILIFTKTLTFVPFCPALNLILSLPTYFPLEALFLIRILLYMFQFFWEHSLRFLCW